jgi:hypothetical protein
METPAINFGQPLHTLERYAGYKALWLRVIIRAAFDLASYKDDRRLEYRKYASNAKKWLFEESYLFNSFENICIMLQIPPGPIRQWASTLTKDEVQKMEHLERGSSSTPKDTLLLAEARIEDDEGENIEWQ